MKRFFCFILSVILIASMPLCVASAENSVTGSRTVTSSAELLYSKKFGANYKNSPTSPLVVEDTLIVASGNYLYKLSAENGKELSKTEMAGSNMYSIVSPLYAEGKIFVVLDGGTVQAFSYETMESLWVYENPMGGQALTSITYSYGYIYTGFWNGETEKGSYVCLSAKDEDPVNRSEAKKARWVYKGVAGFYGAACAVKSGYVVFGRDDGERGSTGKSKIIALDKYTGKLISSLSVKGDIRSGVIYSEAENAFYTASKAGYVYKLSLDSETGKLKKLKTYTASGSITATPVIYNGRLYIGAQNGAKGELLVLNADTLKKLYSGETSGYPQATALVSTGYEAETGKVYVYLTCNSKPGGITVFEDSKGQTSPVSRVLFSPDEAQSEYCISTISADEKGNLYYKNDSGNIFAVGQSAEKISFIDMIIAFIKKLFGM